jgi:hypothetical protein
MMSRIGFGYGSEWHLLRYLGYHRRALNAAVLACTGATAIDWLDAPFATAPALLELDAEWEGAAFLAAATEVHRRWEAFWPQRGSAQRWDAVARLEGSNGPEWLLVEAKAHLAELQAPCQARAVASIAQIDRAFDLTRAAVGATAVSSAVWRGPAYQYANRLAVLYFLRHLCDPPIPARLLFIYFCGDSRRGVPGPVDAVAWQPAITAMRQSLGIDEAAPLMQHVHTLFLSVRQSPQPPVPPSEESRVYPDLHTLLADRLVREEEPAAAALMAQMSPARERGHLTYDEFYAICCWKEPRQRMRRFWQRNAPAFVVDCTAAALATTDERARMDALLRLHGVGLPIASAILTLLFPEDYGVIDIRAWQTLFHYGSVTTNPAGCNFALDEWLTYTDVLRDWAGRFGVGARRVEHTLYLYHWEAKLNRIDW